MLRKKARTKVGVCLQVGRSGYLSFCLSLYQSICLSAGWSAGRSVCLSVCLSVCISVCLAFSIEQKVIYEASASFNLLFVCSFFANWSKSFDSLFYLSCLFTRFLIYFVQLNEIGDLFSLQDFRQNAERVKSPLDQNIRPGYASEND